MVMSIIGMIYASCIAMVQDDLKKLGGLFIHCAYWLDVCRHFRDE